MEVESNIERNGRFTVEEVSKHNTEHDCWVTVTDGVYDVTSFLRQHPGGKVLFGYAGSDATYPFNMSHKSALAIQTLKKYRIGSLENYEPTPIALGIKKLTDDFKKKGYFNCSKSFQAFQFAQVTFLSCVAYWCYWNIPGYTGLILAGLIASLANGQAAWFMHDLGHFSIFRSVSVNRLVQYLVMNIYLGGSYSYWRNAHWKHHLFTNIEGWDHDLDTLPLFAWTKSMFAKMPFKAVGATQEYYWYLFGPGTSFHYIWYLGINFAIRRKSSLSELSGILLHFIGLYFLLGQSLRCVIYTHLTIFTLLGLYMGHIFSLNHFPMHIQDKTEKRAPTPKELRELTGDLVVHQLRTTRDIEPSLLVDWFTGHLNFQIEHHVWPMMPRHNLPKIQPVFEQFCKEHNIPYQKVGFFQAFKDVFVTLSMAHLPEKECS